VKSTSRQEIKKSLRASLAQFLNQFRLIRKAFVHPKVPWHAKAVAGCAVVYIVSPIQLIPNFLPILGQMDDVVVVMLAIRYLKRNVPQTILDECAMDSRVIGPGEAAQIDSLTDRKPVIPTAGSA
jgi:uncharacterized membrane protein YkvA (DUF1232 family)